MPAAHKTKICLGRLQIQVSLYTAIQDNDIHFNQVHKDTKERIQYKKTCPSCEGEVKPEDIIKVFQSGKDEYVIITDDDFECLKTENDKTIQIIHFTDLSTINPIYYEKTYFVIPELGSERAFELLRIAMLDEKQTAIAETVLGTKETMMAILPTETGMTVQTLHYIDEVKDLPKQYTKHDVKPDELETAKTMIRSMKKPFEAGHYYDKYQMRLKELIDTKVQAHEIISANAESPVAIDIIDALRENIINNKATKPEVNRAPKRKSQADKKQEDASRLQPK